MDTSGDIGFWIKLHNERKVVIKSNFQKLESLRRAQPSGSKGMYLLMSTRTFNYVVARDYVRACKLFKEKWDVDPNGEEFVSVNI